MGSYVKLPPTCGAAPAWTAPDTVCAGYALAASEDGTVRTTIFGYGFPNAPHRTLRTPFVERWLPEGQRGSQQRLDEPRIGDTKIGGQRVPLLRFMGFPPTPDASGDLETMDFLAGQSVGLVKEIKPAAEVIQELIEGAS